jgi:hypothetical protein
MIPDVPAKRVLFGLLLLLGVAVVNSPNLFQGLDFTDTGFHLYNQSHSFTNVDPASRFHMPYFLSDYIGGAWLSLHQGPSVLWARVGYLVLLLANVLVCYGFLSASYGAGASACMVGMTSLLVSGHTVALISYDTVGPALANLLLVLLAMLQRRGVNSWRFYACGTLAGAVAAAMALARLPLAASWAGIAVFCLAMRWGPHGPQKAWRSLAVITTAALVTLAGLMLLYRHLGVLNAYLEEILGQVFASATAGSSTHSMKGLLWLQVRQFLPVVPVAGVLIGLVWGAGKFSLHFRFVWLALGLTVLVAWEWRNTLLVRPEIWLIQFALAAILASTVFLWRMRALSRGDLALLLMAVFLMFLVPLGSNGGLFKIAYGFWLPLPLSLLMLRRWMLSQAPGPWRMRWSLARTACIGIGALGLILLWCNVKRDGDRSQLTSPLRHQALAGVHTTARRAQVVDQAFEALALYVRPGETVLMENSIPLTYYLTGSRSWLGDPWLMLESKARLQQRIQEALAKGPSPRVIVLGCTNTRKSSWPVPEIAIKRDLEKLACIRQYLLGPLKYHRAWGNSLLDVYVLTPQSQPNNGLTTDSSIAVPPGN